MGLLIVKTDFTGIYSIPQDTYSKLDAFILKHEKPYLIDLLGAALYLLFKADVNPTTKLPVTQKYLDIYNAFDIDQDGAVISSVGIKEMLLGFLYCEYQRGNRNKNTTVGSSFNAPEVSQLSEFNHDNHYKFYNDAVLTHNVIAQKIQDNPTDYPDFNGKFKDLNFWI